MTSVKICHLLSATLLVLVSISSGHAEDTGYDGGAATSKKSDTGTGMGGSATSGTGARTGHGPLSQPIPPATSTLNPQQDPNRPQSRRGPAQTNPSPQPFGSR